jgi:phospholipid transport system substrate-binding protein
MKMLKRIIPTVTLIAFLFAGGTAAAGDAQDQLKTSIDRIIALLADETLKVPEKKLERRERIFKVLRERFDFAEMGKRSIGRNWKTISQEDKKEFVDAFSKLMQNSYILKIERYSDEEILYKGERTKGKYYYVYTEIVSGDKAIPIGYSLHAKGNNWLVYDVNIEGISMVQNYRSQFNQTIKKEKFAGLMTKIRKQLEKLEGQMLEEQGA